jgi:hypothetical protein
MCWSARRGYEATFDECLATIDDAIVRLRNLGATSIVAGGFSLGGNGAIAFGAGHHGLLGVFALAPAHDARALAERPDIAESIARAQKLVADGKGEKPTSFADVAFGPAGAYTTEVATTSTSYLSFFGPASHADIADNLLRLPAPLLWVAGADDPTQGGGFVFDPMPMGAASPRHRRGGSQECRRRFAVRDPHEAGESLKRLTLLGGTRRKLRQRHRVAAATSFSHARTAATSNPAATGPLGGRGFRRAEY